MKLRIRLLLPYTLVLSAWMVFTYAPANAASCTHYASPSGTGSGASNSSPFKIANFWPIAKPGSTLCLLDGQYTGSASMIDPPDNLKGAPSSPITVRALNDGKVLLNGQSSRPPINFYRNDWFVVEGVNACCSSIDVLRIGYSNNITIRRVIGWDAADRNYMIFSLNNGQDNLLEDVAGWGIGRKIIESCCDANRTTVRRFWGRWEGSHVVGPKMVISLAYDNYNMIVENAIGSWSGERMKSTYVLGDYYGNPWKGNGAGTYTNHAVDQPYGIFAVDGFTKSNRNANSKLLGSIAYITPTDRFNAYAAVFVTAVDRLELKDAAVFVDTSQSSKKKFSLNNISGYSGYNGSGLTARNLTGIGGSASIFQSQWQKSNILEGSGLSVYGSGENLFNTTRGAKLCHRYKDGILTSQPLWPWPMNQRIMDAMVASGRSSLDVTKTVERMFGPIPSACRSSGSGSSPGSPPTDPDTPPNPTLSFPSAPTNLQVTP